MTMGWVAPPRSPEAAAVHAAAEDDRRGRPERYRFDAEAVAERAARGGDVGVFAPGWREGLEQYLESAEEDGRLGAFGTRMVLDTAVSRLRAGASVAAYLEVHPEVGARELAPPIVIVGGWRTGTTFLFRLLATDPRLRAPLPVELGTPWRMVGLHGVERDEKIEASAVAHEMLDVLNPQLAAVHDSGARLPEECVLAIGSDLRNWGFTSTTRLDAYADWLADQDLAGSYARYRDVLRMLDDGDGRRWVLKAPAHTAELAHVVATFPGATVVHLHRDIVETVASGASLFAVFRSTYSDEVDAADVGRFQADQTERWFRRAVAFRADPASSGATFVDLDYRALIAEPTAALATIYEAVGIEPPADLSAFVGAYDDAHPRGSHGVHRYSADDFGLVPDELRERFAFLEGAFVVPG